MGKASSQSQKSSADDEPIPYKFIVDSDGIEMRYGAKS